MRRLLWMGLGLVALLVLSLGVASAEPGDRVLSLGAQGQDVVSLQQGLTDLGYPVPATGYYGTMTQRAVAAFQAAAGLPITGKADAAAIQELRSRIAELETPSNGDYDGDFPPPVRDGYGPYASPWSPYQGGPGGSYGAGSYGWGTPMGPGMMGGGIMGGMMGGGWAPGGSWGAGTTRSGWWR